jgi:hypothetical protein
MSFTLATPIQLYNYDFPNVRSNSPTGNAPLQPFTLTITQGYQGVIALTPTPANASIWEVVLYIDKDFGGSSVTWTPTTAAYIIDVPIGFNIGNGPAIASWINRFNASQASSAVGAQEVILSSAQQAKEGEARARQREASTEKREVKKDDGDGGSPPVVATGHP